MVCALIQNVEKEPECVLNVIDVPDVGMRHRVCLENRGCYMLKISNEVIDVLANSRVNDNKLFLPDYQLERKLYLAVNKVLTSLGGKWTRKEKAHVFESNPSDVIEEALMTGQYMSLKQQYQFFETPYKLAQQMVYRADITQGDTILEPSAGRGGIAHVLEDEGYDCDVVELNDKNREFLTENGFNIVGTDFLKFNERYDIIIANPPFTKQQDIDHVNHMIDIANKRVISVMSAGVTFRTNKKTVQFRERVESLGGIIEMLPENSFAESGTKVNTCLVIVDI